MQRFARVFDTPPMQRLFAKDTPNTPVARHCSMAGMGGKEGVAFMEPKYLAGEGSTADPQQYDALERDFREVRSLPSAVRRAASTGVRPSDSRKDSRWGGGQQTVVGYYCLGVRQYM